MIGEERRQRICDDLLQARLIAASVQERRGRPRQEHPIFSEPDEIIWHHKRPDRPLFYYGERGCFRIEGEPEKPYLVEIWVRGPIAWRKFYDPLGRRCFRDGFPVGRPEWN